MVNRSIFGGSATAPERVEGPPADAVNEAGGLSYTPGDEEALAQLALTGTFAHTFYATGEEQLAKTLALASRCEPTYVAKLAIRAREHGLMKDTPVVLLAHLFARRHVEFLPADPRRTEAARSKLLSATFRRVVTDTKALRNFAQVVRGGGVGRRSFGTLAKRLMREFLVETKSPRDLFFGSIGDRPTLGDVVNMVHPKATTKEQHALFRWLIGKTERGKGFYAEDCEILNAWIEWKKAPTPELPDAPFEMLTGEAGKDARLWKQIALKATFNQVRQTLRAFVRNGVFEDDPLVSKDAIVAQLVERLVDEERIKRARIFPYALMTSYRAAETVDVPKPIVAALVHALDVSLANVPELEGFTYVFVDVSGSMSSPVTSARSGASTTVSCREVAALYAAALAARMPGRVAIVPFADNALEPIRPDGDVSYLALYNRICDLPSGGTNCSAPMRWLVDALVDDEVAKPATVVYLSDNESWIDARRVGGATATYGRWKQLKSIAPDAKLVCVDLQPYVGRQVPDDVDVLNVGGFSNSVFDLVATFARGELDAARMRASVESVVL